MHRSIVTRTMINDLLTTARQQKEKYQELMPVLLSTNNMGKGSMLPLPDLAADAEARRNQFLVLGKLFPDIVEAVFVCETWFVAADTTVDAFKVMPSQHPSRQEAIMITGRNRSNTKCVLALQPFSKNGKDISWQSPQVFTKPGCAQGPIDLLFAP